MGGLGIFGRTATLKGADLPYRRGKRENGRHQPGIEGTGGTGENRREAEDGSESRRTGERRREDEGSCSGAHRWIQGTLQEALARDWKDWQDGKWFQTLSIV